MRLNASATCLAALISCFAFVWCEEAVWGYECKKNFCQKARRRSSLSPAIEDVTSNEYPDDNNLMSLGECRLLCSKFASIWPQPTGKLQLDNNTSMTQLNINSVDVLVKNTGDSPLRDLVNRASRRFKKQLLALEPSSSRRSTTPLAGGGKSLEVSILVDDMDAQFQYGMDESYTLRLKSKGDRLLAYVLAENFFGARHALETLSQLAFYDEIHNEIRMPGSFYVEDAPKYTHRGLQLDTARNYISVETIKRTLEGMAASKLNIFHWHLTDSHSFPYVSASAPQLSRLGAYTQDKVYDADDVREIVEFARERGIMVLPEFDAPAHVGEGWQDTGLLACFNKKPWQQYCVEPPCGQLDPTQEGVYEMLSKIYKDMVRQFDPSVFHMGGDEVNENCWQSEERIVQWMQDRNMSIDDAGFMRLWDHFQRKALHAYEKERGHRTPIIMWTSKLTSKPYLTHYLNNETYIIQIWTKRDDDQVKNALANNFRIILSNFDALYLDCGFGGWVNDGNNWCSPYIGWQKVYENFPAEIAGDKKHLVLGSEAVLWTEQADDTVVDGRLWPRAAAMAETLWSEPRTSWKEAEDRFVIHRERLVKLKINADAIQPLWCQQHQNSCPLDGELN